jgi:hypothetical protein
MNITDEHNNYGEYSNNWDLLNEANRRGYKLNVERESCSGLEKFNKVLNGLGVLAGFAGLCGIIYVAEKIYKKLYEPERPYNDMQSEKSRILNGSQYKYSDEQKRKFHFFESDDDIEEVDFIVHDDNEEE